MAWIRCFVRTQILQRIFSFPYLIWPFVKRKQLFPKCWRNVPEHFIIQFGKWSLCTQIITFSLEAAPQEPLDIECLLNPAAVWCNGMSLGSAGTGFGFGTTGKLGRAWHRCMGGAWHRCTVLAGWEGAWLIYLDLWCHLLCNARKMYLTVFKLTRSSQIHQVLCISLWSNRSIKLFIILEHYVGLVMSQHISS